MPDWMSQLDPTTLLLGIIGCAVAFVVGAVLLVLRDLSSLPPESSLAPRAFGGASAPFGDAARHNSGRLAQRSPAVPRLRMLPSAGSLAKDATPLERFDHSLHRLSLEAGFDSGPLAMVLLMIALGLALGGGLLIATDNPIPAAIGALIGIVAGFVWMRYQRATRLQKCMQQLPEVLGLLARAVRAGESLEQAVVLVGDNAAQPLGQEFRRCAGHLRTGLSVPATMQALADRIPLMEMKILANTLAVHRQSGGNLATTLERLSTVIRDRLHYRRQLKATTGAGRMSASMIMIVGPLLFAYLFFFQPDYVRSLLEESTGQIMLAVAVALELTGMVWVARMVKAQY